MPKKRKGRGSPPRADKSASDQVAVRAKANRKSPSKGGTFSYAVDDFLRPAVASENGGTSSLPDMDVSAVVGADVPESIAVPVVAATATVAVVPAPALGPVPPPDGSDVPLPADAGDTDDDGTVMPRKRLRTDLVDGFAFLDTSVRHVRIECTSGTFPNELRKLNPFDTNEALQDLIGTYVSCKTLKSVILLVECDDFAQVKLLLDVSTFMSYPVEATVAYNIDTVRGVVRDARISDMDHTLLLDKLRSQHVVQVRPIFTGSGADKRRSDFMILTFRLAKLPDRVIFGKERMSLTPYRIRVVQCSHCLTFGHRAELCRKAKACSHCGARGSDHVQNACLALPARCALCSKAHKATDKDCPKYRRQRAILKIREEHKVGFKNAEDIYKRKNGSQVAAAGGDRASAAPPPRKRAAAAPHVQAASAPHSRLVPAIPSSLAQGVALVSRTVPSETAASYRQILLSPKPGTSASTSAGVGRGRSVARSRPVPQATAETELDDSFSDQEVDVSVVGCLPVDKPPDPSLGLGKPLTGATSRGRERPAAAGPDTTGVSPDIIFTIPARSGQRDSFCPGLQELGCFLKQLPKVLEVVGGSGSVCIHCKPLSLIIAKYFNIPNDAQWCYDAML